MLPPPQTRGNKVDEEQLKALVPGTSTKADVTALIGSPTQKAMFDENTWLYITEVTRPRVGQTLGLLDQGVVVLSFDDRGVLTGVKDVNKEDAVPVTVVSRTTPSPGTEASFMQQLLGNIGKFNPAHHLTRPAVARRRPVRASELRNPLAAGRFRRQT